MPLKIDGKDIIFEPPETEGETKLVRCKECAYEFYVTFFRLNPKPEDAASCPECRSNSLEWAE